MKTMRIPVALALTLMALVVAKGYPYQEGGDDPSRSVLETTRKRGDTELEKLQETTEVIVVKGHFDAVEKVLTALQIKYDLIAPNELPSKDLSQYIAMFINCLGQHTGKGRPMPQKAGLPIPGEMKPMAPVPEAMKSKVRAFVEKGGYLYTDDWTVALTSGIFPEYIKPAKHIAEKLDTDTVPVKPYSSNADHPFLKDVFSYGDKGGGTGMLKKVKAAQWVIDGGSLSYNITGLTSSASVKTLLVSDEMQKKYGNHLIAVTFDVRTGLFNTGGDTKKKNPGVVFHVLGHFFQQGLGNKDNDEVAKMYQMIVNFVLEAKKAHNKK